MDVCLPRGSSQIIFFSKSTLFWFKQSYKLLIPQAKLGWFSPPPSYPQYNESSKQFKASEVKLLYVRGFSVALTETYDIGA
jgi:hypothetical protein